MTPPPPPRRNPQGGSQGRKGPRHRDTGRASSSGDQRPGGGPGRNRRDFGDGPRKRQFDGPGPGSERRDRWRQPARPQEDYRGRSRPQATNDGDRRYGPPARQNRPDRPRGRDRDRDRDRDRGRERDHGRSWDRQGEREHGRSWGRQGERERDWNRDRSRDRGRDERPVRRQDRFEQRDNHWSSDPEPAGDAFRHQPEAAEATDDLVWGRHAAEAALNGERPIHRVWCTPELRFNTRFMQLLREAKSSGVVVEEVTWARLAQLCNGAVHQGIVLQVAAAETIQLDTLVAHCDQCGEPPLLVAVDGITDPHNLGAIVRTAEAFAAQGMVIPQRRNAGLTGSVAKVAAGALEHLPVARVVNLNRSLEELKQAGYTVIGLAGDGAMSIAEVPAADPLVVVTGSEGSGLSLMTRKHCDHLVRIPLRGETPSLNGSVASGVVLYEIARQRWLGKLSGTMPAPPRPLKLVPAVPPQTVTGGTDRLVEEPSAESGHTPAAPPPEAAPDTKPPAESPAAAKSPAPDNPSPVPPLAVAPDTKPPAAAKPAEPPAAHDTAPLQAGNTSIAKAFKTEPPVATDTGPSAPPSPEAAPAEPPPEAAPDEPPPPAKPAEPPAAHDTEPSAEAPAAVKSPAPDNPSPAPPAGSIVFDGHISL